MSERRRRCKSMGPREGSWAPLYRAERPPWRACQGAAGGACGARTRWSSLGRTRARDRLGYVQGCGSRPTRVRGGNAECLGVRAKRRGRATGQRRRRARRLKEVPTGGPHLSVRGRGGRPVGPEREVGPGLLLGRAGVEQERKKGREGRENWAGLEEEREICAGPKKKRER